eukprot:766984-Hanusia_phi.AAC.6
MLSTSSGDIGGQSKRKKAIEIQRDARVDIALNATLANIFTARRIVENGTWEEYVNSFHILPQWLQKNCLYNPRSHFAFVPQQQSIPNATFRGLFFANGTILHLIEKCGMRMLGQDYTHISSRLFQGKAMVCFVSESHHPALTCIFLLYTGIFAQWKTDKETVGAETIDNTVFTWEQLKATTLCRWLSPSSGQLTVATDCGSGILPGLERSVPHADIVYCAMHLLMNVNSHVKGTNEYMSMPDNTLLPILRHRRSNGQASGVQGGGHSERGGAVQVRVETRRGREQSVCVGDRPEGPRIEPRWTGEVRGKHPRPTVVIVSGLWMTQYSWLSEKPGNR